MNTVRLFAGGLTKIHSAGQWTGIYKQALAAAVQLGYAGLAGDRQADRRVHGGPEKALHHYAAENYLRLADSFPDLAAALIAGSLGENVSTTGIDEASVCIGDVYRLGSARLQVSQPRSPCWKIDHRYGREGVAQAIRESGLTGWYYRVLDCGTVASGDAIELIERLPAAVSLAELWQLWQQHRPDPTALERLAGAPALNAEWRQKLLSRVAWLRANA